MSARKPMAKRTARNRTPADAAPSAAVAKQNSALHVQGELGKSEDRMIADGAVSGLVINIMTLATYSRGTFRELSESECALSLLETTNAVNRGDLTAAEMMLTAQAVALNAIFGELARRASLNMGQHLEAMERYMRLALKAQGQCRATLETLAAIKNPPVVFARQANIAHGPQQVNNGVPLGPVTRAAKVEFAQSELLEARDGERLDFGAQSAASGTHPDLEPLDKLDGAEKRGG